jgi:CheY-like chemotaxis protein
VTIRHQQGGDAMRSNTNPTEEGTRSSSVRDDHVLRGLKRKNKDRLNPPRCLVVDDNADVLHYVARMLSRLGYQVDTAEKRPHVMARLATGPYDLIVTDLEMPDMNGFHLAVTIKTECRASKVIIMTGRFKEDCVEMMATGWADGWIFKPFGLTELRNMMEAFGCLEK